jgi:hypothetical protein
MWNQTTIVVVSPGVNVVDVGAAQQSSCCSLPPQNSKLAARGDVGVVVHFVEHPASTTGHCVVPRRHTEIWSCCCGEGAKQERGAGLGKEPQQGNAGDHGEEIAGGNTGAVESALKRPTALCDGPWLGRAELLRSREKE